MFEWKEEYSLNTPQIDNQHKTLFRLAEEMHAAMAQGKGKEVMGATLARLVQYTAEHFATEERLMRITKYPMFEAHLAEHRALTKQAGELLGEFKAGRTPITVEVLHFLRNWLDRHIKGWDLKFGAYYVKRSAA